MRVVGLTFAGASNWAMSPPARRVETITSSSSSRSIPSFDEGTVHDVRSGIWSRRGREGEEVFFEGFEPRAH
jgi:hypothetical protein